MTEDILLQLRILRDEMRDKERILTAALDAVTADIENISKEIYNITKERELNASS